MKKYFYLFLGLMILFTSCQSKKAAEKEAQKELTREERIALRTQELEKVVEKSLAKSGTDSNSSIEGAGGGSWGDAPDFTLDKLNGGKLTLSDYAGKVIILDFWATWCGPCRMGIPDFVELYKNYRSKGFVLIGVNLDKGSMDKVKSFVSEMKINYPTVLGNDQVVKDLGGIRGIPTAFIIDRKGNVVNKVVGYRPGSFFESEIKKLL